ncbi:lipase maturation factor family protein [Microbacterium sp. RD1]|uniref:lipase maturation factor family protein n=1 Tax=Microbacterium sp. RD1 TaxID=3457313 RepID=UPI003FA52C87
MDGFAAVAYVFGREVVQRGVAAVYVVAFVSTIAQFPALLGERGLSPAPRLLAWARSSKRARRLLHPTIFRWWPYSDRRLTAICVAGIAVALALVAGLPQLAPPWVPLVCFLFVWATYMSVVSIGQTFYGFGWEMLLLEAGFLAGFLGSSASPPPTVVVVLLWWLLFRLEFGAGMIKIRGGAEWRDLSALTFHHETQPMPGPLSRQAHLLPRWFHEWEVLGNHFSQLVVPWFLFVPALRVWIPWDGFVWIGTAAAAVVIATQLWLVATGNFAWLNVLTIIVAFSAVGLPGAAPAAVLPLPWLWVTLAVAIAYAVISWPALRNLTARRQLMNAAFNRWNLANAYGAFGTVTRRRVEYVIVGTESDDPADRDAVWLEYAFRGKPGDVSRIPPQIAPYHLRLDWLMWFLPLGRSLDDWFEEFLARLLDADPRMLRLLAHDPFEGRRPAWLRVDSYHYRFTTRSERRATGHVWARTRLATIRGPVGRAESANR